MLPPSWSMPRSVRRFSRAGTNPLGKGNEQPIRYSYRRWARATDQPSLLIQTERATQHHRRRFPRALKDACGINANLVAWFTSGGTLVALPNCVPTDAEYYYWASVTSQERVE